MPPDFIADKEKLLRAMAEIAAEINTVEREPGDEAPPKPGEVIPKVISIRASEVVPDPIDWLWEPYLQRDTLNGFYGNPGVGKGNTGIEIIACVTVPRHFPGESVEDFAERKPINVCVLAAEEGVANTIIPRLMAAGANLDRVRIIKSIEYYRDGVKTADRMIVFEQDIAAIRADLAEHHEEKFLYVDPVTSYFGDVNGNQDSEVRPVLQLLLNLADEMKITILIVGHFNKNSSLVSAIDKASGGRAWVAMCRAAWGFFRKPEDHSQRVMANLKLNNAKESDTTIFFTIAEKEIGKKSNGKPWMMPIIAWGERSSVTADDLVATEQPQAKRDTKGVQLIEEILAINGIETAYAIMRAAEEKSVSVETMKRAAKSLGILKYKRPEIDGRWYWQHPSCQTPIPSDVVELNAAARARRFRDMEAAKAAERWSA